MALGTATAGAEAGKAPGAPTFLAFLSFPGDSSYPTGGTLAFQAYVRAALGGRAVTVLGVIPQDCGIYRPMYLPGTGALMVRTMADGTQVANATNLSATTFNVLVVCQ